MYINSKDLDIVIATLFFALYILSICAFYAVR